MKYIFLAFIFCFLWAFNMAAIIEYYEIKRVKDKGLESQLAQCEDEKFTMQREVSTLWKEKMFWIKEAKRKK